jgi:hypothetical protein
MLYPCRADNLTRASPSLPGGRVVYHRMASSLVAVSRICGLGIIFCARNCNLRSIFLSLVAIDRGKPATHYWAAFLTLPGNAWPGPDYRRTEQRPDYVQYRIYLRCRSHPPQQGKGRWQPARGKTHRPGGRPAARPAGAPRPGYVLRGRRDHGLCHPGGGAGLRRGQDDRAECRLGRIRGRRAVGPLLRLGPGGGEQRRRQDRLRLGRPGRRRRRGVHVTGAHGLQRAAMPPSA